MADTWYVDLENGSDSNTGASYAQRWKTLAKCTAVAGVDPTDTVRVMASPAPTSLGQTATWTDNSGTVTLTTAVTVTIDNCESGWTDDDANITTSHIATTPFAKEGTNIVKCIIASGFTTGKACYKNLSTTVLDGYEQISFWIYTSASTTASGDLQIKLCSDDAGDTPVYTFDIPIIVGTRWTPVVIDNSVDMTTDIESIALYVAVDRGAMDVYLDNIIACKADTANDSLTHLSLIGLNTAGETWYPIKSIVGTAIILDCGPQAVVGTTGKWVGSTNSYTTYKRETIKTTLATAADTFVQQPAAPGSLALGNVTYSGGWNRTDMSTQDAGDATWIDGRNGWGYGYYSILNYVTYTKLYATRYSVGIYPRSQNRYWSIQDAHVNGNTSQGIRLDYSASYNNAAYALGTVYACCNGAEGFRVSNGYAGISVDEIIAHGNGSSGVYVGCGRYGKITAKSNLLYGLSWCVGPVYIQDLTTANNATAAVYLAAMSTADLMLRNASIGETLSYSFVTGMDWNTGRIVSQDHGSLGVHEIWAYGGNIKSETGADLRHTASGISWKMSPTSTNRESRLPLDFVLGTFAVNADAEVTVTCWMRRSNTGLTGKLVCRGGQIPGVASDVTDSVTEVADTWEQLSIAFTPTEAGVVQIEAWAYGGTTYSLYVDDLAISQA